MAEPSSFRVNGIWAGGSIAGDIIPTVTNAVTLGSASLRFANVYSVLGNFSGALTGDTATFTSLGVTKAGANEVAFFAGTGASYTTFGEASNDGIFLGWNATSNVGSIGHHSSGGTIDVGNTAGVLNLRGTITAAATVATPAGGGTTARLLFGTTAGFGVYYGSGVPTVTAAQGSVYLRSDGSSTSTRFYVNTDGGTTWTNVVTAA